MLVRNAFADAWLIHNHMHSYHHATLPPHHTLPQKPSNSSASSFPTDPQYSRSTPWCCCPWKPTPARLSCTTLVSTGDEWWMMMMMRMMMMMMMMMMTVMTDDDDQHCWWSFIELWWWWIMMMIDAGDGGDMNDVMSTSDFLWFSCHMPARSALNFGCDII